MLYFGLGTEASSHVLFTPVVHCFNYKDIGSQTKILELNTCPNKTSEIIPSCYISVTLNKRNISSKGNLVLVQKM